MEITIKELSAKHIDEYLFFFDNVLFAENPEWSKCYCYSYHFTGPDEAWTRDNNREAVSRLIADGKMRGYLAYDGSKAIGWCNANDKSKYQALNEHDSSAKNVCSIVCFLISPQYRRKGIAQKILKQIIRDYTQKGYEYIESYPRKGDHSCERNYHGHLSLYEKYDFNVVKEYNDRYIVRKSLKT